MHATVFDQVIDEVAKYAIVDFFLDGHRCDQSGKNALQLA
jgi:hypothetical protein